MADELDPIAAAETTGDPGDPGAESDPGTQGESEPTVAELQAQLAEMQRREELLLKSVARSGGRAAAEAPVNPPTAPDPRAEGQLRASERKAELRRAELARLADQGDKVAEAALELDDKRKADLDNIGNALRHVYGELQDLKAERGIPDAEINEWKVWHKEHRGDYNSVEAARLGFAGHKALEAAQNPKPPAPPPPTNGNGARPVPPRAPAPRQRVDIRPMGATETRREVAKMTGDDFDAQLEALQASNDPADRAAARALQGRMNAGELDVAD